MNAKSIVQLLADKHSDDIFVPECKDGPTMFGGHSRIDALVIPKSWTNPAVTGYEIKASRSDFLQDDKWHNYLPLCNRLYFVCPWKLIEPDELPPEVGLMYVTKTGTRLITKKKAQHRDVEIPESVWRYILMCRARIVDERQPGIHPSNDAKRDYWKRWLESKQIDRRFGWHVSRKIREVLQKRVVQVEKENEDLRRLMEKYDDIRDLLRELNLNPDDAIDVSRMRVRRQLGLARNAIPSDLTFQLEQVARYAERTKASLEKIENGSGDGT